MHLVRVSGDFCLVKYVRLVVFIFDVRPGFGTAFDGIAGDGSGGDIALYCTAANTASGRGTTFNRIAGYIASGRGISLHSTAVYACAGGDISLYISAAVDVSAGRQVHVRIWRCYVDIAPHFYMKA